MQIIFLLNESYQVEAIIKTLHMCVDNTTIYWYELYTNLIFTFESKDLSLFYSVFELEHSMYVQRLECFNISVTNSQVNYCRLLNKENWFIQEMSYKILTLITRFKVQPEMMLLHFCSFGQIPIKQFLYIAVHDPKLLKQKI